MNFKTKIVMILLSSILITNCKEEMKSCVSQSPDIKVKLYNDLTDQLIPIFFGEDYLGDKRYFDSLRVANDDKYIEERTKAHNELFNNPEKFCNLYIDSIKNKPTFFAKVSTKFTTFSTNFATDNTEANINRIKRKKEFLKEFSNISEVREKLSKRSSIKANQFNLCTANVLDLAEYDKHTNECEIGVVYFSEIVFDTSKKKALVFVDHRIKNYFNRTAIFKLRLNNNYWEIEDYMLVSTS